MGSEIWKAVEGYVVDRLLPSDVVLDAALQATAAAGLPAIEVSPPHGKLLHLLARIQGAKRILEIGTLGGYSTIWLARALPADGRIVTLEVDPKHAEVAMANVARAGLGRVVELRLGLALETLPQLEREGRGAFDFIFIDADKENNAAYLAWALRLSRMGTLIVVDNVIRDGAVADAGTTDPRVQGVRHLYDALASETRVDATAIQTVGSKGYDGLIVAVVNQKPT